MYRRVRDMVFNTMFNHIIVISNSWQSDILVEEIRVPGENHKLDLIMLYQIHLALAELKPTI